MAKPLDGLAICSTVQCFEAGIVEVELAMGGTVSLGSRVLRAGGLLAGRRVETWIEDRAPLLFFDPDTWGVCAVPAEPAPARQRLAVAAL